MHESETTIPDDALQALRRSAARGCPVGQLKLAGYLARGNRLEAESSTEGIDEEVKTLLQAAAGSGLCEAFFELGNADLFYERGFLFTI
jgi:hypothetical protein